MKVTGEELIAELAKRGLDMSRAKVVSANLPEPDGNGGWVMPKETTKATIRVTDGHMKVNERKVPAYPERWVVIGHWHIGPGGYRSSEDFSGWVGVTQARSHVVHLTDDLDELAEILAEVL